MAATVLQQSDSGDDVVMAIADGSGADDDEAPEIDYAEILSKPTLEVSHIKNI